jgi:hypothetical protein
MTVIGVLLILVAVGLLLIGLLAGSDAGTTLSLGGVDISMSAMGVFLMGAATVLIFVSGLELLRSGLRRSLRRRRELREARAVVAERERRDGETGALHTETETAPAETASGTGAAAATGTAAGTDAAGTDAAGTGTAETAAHPETTAPAPGASDTTGTRPGADDDPGRHTR